MPALFKRVSKSNTTIAASLFIIALLPRIFGLGRFLTSDEPLWLVRSLHFSQALLGGNWAGTLQTGHPGVTTMWSGSVGLGLAYWQQSSADSFQQFLAGLSHNSDRIDAFLVPWFRLPTALLAALCVALLYRLAVDLMGRPVALVAALLLAFDPLFLAHSRTLHHDALATIFIMLSVLFLLNFPRTGAMKYILLSGIMAGLALLSKGTSLALFGFAPLFLAWLWFSNKRTFGSVLKAGLGWLAAAAALFVALWPAMWVIPGQVLTELFGWVLVSADITDVADTTSFDWAGRVPELGLLFYPVNWLLKSTLLSIVGLAALPGWWLDSRHRHRRWVVVWLAIFALLFALLLTRGDKRDGRYLLPIYPGLWLLSAAGLVWLAGRVINFMTTRWPSLSRQRVSAVLIAVFIGLLLAFSLPWYPYYHTYYNPLIGGSQLAPRLIKVGWGEGMEKVAAYLNQQPNAAQQVVATSYAQNLLPFFAGDSVKHHQTAPSDYVLNYVRQIQNGYPFPEYWQYYQPRPPVYQLQLDGIDYLWLYHESALVRVRNAQLAGRLELMAYTHRPRLIEPSQTVELTLVWRVADDKFKDAPVRVELIDGDGQVWGAAPPAPVLDPSGPSPVEGHYQLQVAPDAPRRNGQFSLTVETPAGDLLGPLIFGDAPIRQTSLLASATPLPAQNLNGQIALAGYEINRASLEPGQDLVVTLYWQAQTSLNFDYTVFTQLLSPKGTITGQHDSQPVNGQLPTGQWSVGEIVADPHPITVAADAAPGQYQLLVGMYRWDTGERLPLLDEAGNPSGTAIDLTMITVE